MGGGGVEVPTLRQKSIFLENNSATKSMRWGLGSEGATHITYAGVEEGVGASHIAYAGVWGRGRVTLPALGYRGVGGSRSHACQGYRAAASETSAKN